MVLIYMKLLYISETTEAPTTPTGMFKIMYGLIDFKNCNKIVLHIIRSIDQQSFTYFFFFQRCPNAKGSTMDIILTATVDHKMALIHLKSVVS